MRRSVFSVAAILGPLWAGGALSFDNYYTLLGVELAMVVFVMVSAIVIVITQGECNSNQSG